MLPTDQPVQAQVCFQTSRPMMMKISTSSSPSHRQHVPKDRYNLSHQDGCDHDNDSLLGRLLARPTPSALNSPPFPRSTPAACRGQLSLDQPQANQVLNSAFFSDNGSATLPLRVALMQKCAATKHVSVVISLTTSSSAKNPAVLIQQSFAR